MRSVKPKPYITEPVIAAIFELPTYKALTIAEKRAVLVELQLLVEAKS